MWRLRKEVPTATAIKVVHFLHLRSGSRARDFGQYESQALNVPKNIMAVGRGETAVPVLPRAAKLDGKTTM